MNKKKNAKTIVVAGDVTIDWNIARVRRADVIMHVWNAENLTTSFCQRGGAAMLTDLIKSITGNLNQTKQTNITVRQISTPWAPINPCNNHFHHSYAIWAPFKIDERESYKGEKVWRVQEFLGLCQAYPNTSQSNNWKKVVDDPINPDLVILDDAALGFRDSPEYWPQSLSKSNSKPWILLKMSRPVAQGRLWNHLLQNHADRLIVVMTVDDLRLSQVHISRQISWERTAQDIFWELIYNPKINAISHCAAAIVFFPTEGAVILSKNKSKSDITSRPNAKLVFDSLNIEGTWRQQYSGKMMGYSTCLTAAIVKEILKSYNEPDIENGLTAGIKAMRLLHLKGYDKGADNQKMELSFPFKLIASELDNNENPFSLANIQDPLRFLDLNNNDEYNSWWTILRDKYLNKLDLLSRRIVCDGPESALKDVPQGRFGYMLTVDRREIESFRNIHNLASEHINKGRQKRPLSIAVFGAPGSGKSFGIVQIAKSIAPGQIEVIEFNLSQFKSPEELASAFHLVRDAYLRGKLPLVFWDEFDTALEGERLGWLRYFLSPMQNGSFQEGQIVHPIGGVIFVFAGGTCNNLKSFGQGLEPEEYITKKIPDFISRLKGYINIMGPNRQISESESGEASDPYYIIRRAICLRSLLEQNSPLIIERREGKKCMNIDPGVLLAFLEIGYYKHGLRSIEAIINMSKLSGKKSFSRSSLPSETQLELHVNGKEFLSLAQKIELEGETLERLAEQNHNLFCEEMKAKGYRYGQVTDNKLKTHSSLCSYSELPADEKEQNRSSVRDIPEKLASIDYIMIPARSNETVFNFPEDDDDVEKLAKMEHERWMQEKIKSGCSYATKTDKENKVHEALLSWEKLPEYEKEKDRNLVKGITKILAKAGYTMIKLR